MKIYQQPTVNLIALQCEDIVTASVYAKDAFDDDWRGVGVEEGK